MVGLVLAEDQPLTDTGLDRAVWLRQQGRYQDSLAILENEIRGKNYKENTKYRADCWLNMALDYWNLGEVSRAENAFIYVMALVGELQDESLRDYASTALKIIKLYQEGKAKREAKKFNDADKIFSTAINLSRSKNMDEIALKCLRQLSFVLWPQKKYSEIFYLNEKALMISTQINNKYEQVRSLNQLGAYYFEKRDVLRSYDYFDRALVLAEKENFLHKEPVIMLNPVSYTHL
ncbi:MAG: hypothetical protein N3G18_07140, partial [Candidatus Saccharicenans sp.]|nr:hypothetical protein [Candidatus Saccharicenans sp.]